MPQHPRASLDTYRLRTQSVSVCPVQCENASGADFSTHPHSHEFNELVVVFSGTSVHVTEMGEYPVRAGDVFVIMAGEVHGYRDSRDLALANVLYTPEALRSELEDIRGLSGYHALFTLEPHHRHLHQLQSCLSLDTAQLAAARHLVERLTQEIYADRPGCRFMARVLFLELVGFLARAYTDSKRDTTRPLLRLGAVMGLMERHFDRTTSLEELAREANMSKSTLLRTFRKVLGVTPIEYLLRLRIEQACNLLRDTDWTVGTVARRTGFSDSNYFARQFRRLRGMAPTAWRARAVPPDGASPRRKKNFAS